MASRFQFLFLVGFLFSLTAAQLWAAENADEQSVSVASEESEDNEEQSIAEAIEPDIARREIEEPEIDGEDFEISIYTGRIAIEDFGSSSVTGAAIAYHITEDFFAEINYASATAGKTSFEVLSGGSPFLTEDERDFTYYDFSLAFQLRGETFFGENYAFNNALYFAAGAGNTDFGGDGHFTINYGFGYKMLMNDWTSIRFDVRDYVFASDLLGEEKTTHNIVYRLGLSIFF